MWLFLVGPFIFVAIGLSLIIILTSFEDSSLGKWLRKNRTAYYIYHAILTGYLIPLGEFGKDLHKRSFYNLLMVSYNYIEPEVRKLKMELFKEFPELGLGKKIVEVGIGPGHNFEFYPKRCELIAVEPSAASKELVTQRLKKHDGIQLKEFHVTGAEDMSMIEEDSIDVVVGTWLICSVQKPDLVLGEILRILKPGGRFYFFEHVLAQPRSSIRTFQKLLKPLWKFWCCGCVLQDASVWIHGVGFSKVQEHREWLGTNQWIPIPIEPHYYGVAIK